MSGIFRIDDGGAIYHVSADSHDAALAQWSEQCRDDGCDMDNLDPPEIRRLQLSEAAEVMVRDDEHREPCPTCGTSNAVASERSLLALWQEDNALSAESRARYGILCCSEWP